MTIKRAEKILGGFKTLRELKELEKTAKNQLARQAVAKMLNQKRRCPYCKRLRVYANGGFLCKVCDA